jgi:DNA-binding transcriptional MerR regulator
MAEQEQVETVETTNEEQVTLEYALSTLEWLTTEELSVVEHRCKELKKAIKTQAKQEKIAKAIELYAEVNALGKKIYTLPEVSKLTGVSVHTLKKELPKKEVTNA